MSTKTKKTTEKTTTDTERAVKAIMGQAEQAVPAVPPVKLYVPFHAAMEEIERLYGLSSGNLAGTQGAILAELVWARLERRANNG